MGKSEEEMRALIKKTWNRLFSRPEQTGFLLTKGYSQISPTYFDVLAVKRPISKREEKFFIKTNLAQNHLNGGTKNTVGYIGTNSGLNLLAMNFFPLGKNPPEDLLGKMLASALELRFLEALPAKFQNQRIFHQPEKGSPRELHLKSTNRSTALRVPMTVSQEKEALREYFDARGVNHKARILELPHRE